MKFDFDEEEVSSVTGGEKITWSATEVGVAVGVGDEAGVGVADGAGDWVAVGFAVAVGAPVAVAVAVGELPELPELQAASIEKHNEMATKTVRLCHPRQRYCG